MNKKSKFSKKEVQKLMRKLLKKGQNWSLDLILGIVIFILILSLFYMLLTRNESVDVKILKTKGNTILNIFDSQKSNLHLTILDGDTINKTKIEELYGSDSYEDIKKDLGLTGDFCIIVEDSNGRVIAINTSTGYKYGFGNPDLNVSGFPCGADITP